MGRRFVLLLAALVFVVTVGQSAASAAPPSPIAPENRPTPIAGQINGEVDPAQLVTVEGNCRVARAAATSLLHLLAAARGDGIDLVPDDCYRPFVDQIATRASACANGNCSCAASVPTTPGVRGGTSMHGWGKAVDFGQGTLSIRSTAMTGYLWLKANGARFGWNHPGWAEPGGGTCAEPWHWEWVGDGGTIAGASIVTDAVAGFSTANGQGAFVVSGLGAVVTKGNAVARGSLSAGAIADVITGAARTPTGNGYWMTDTRGAVRAFGDAALLGDMSRFILARQVVGMATTPSGQGYRLVASDGGLFAFGDALFLGSMGGAPIYRPVVGMASTPSGRGYWMVASDGGVFAFGDAPFLGSMGAVRLNHPVVGMAATPSGRGYWLVADDGGVFAFGDAVFRGSLGGVVGGSPTVGMMATPSGSGYWLVAGDSTLTPFGDASALAA